MAQAQTRSYRHLLAQWAMSNVAHWGVMAIVSLYLLTILRLPAVAAATTLFAVTLMSRLSRLAAMPVISHLGGRGGLRLGLALGLAGDLGLALLSWPPAVAVLLLLLGTAYSTTALAIKAIVAELPVGSQLMRYASINLWLNAGAAAGPVLANALFLHWQPRGAFVAGAAMYAAAIALSARLPSLPVDRGGSEGLRRRLTAALSSRGLWRAVLLNTLGFFLFSQLYATLPLYVGSVLRMPDLLGALIAVNGIVAVLVQLPLMRLATRRRIGPMPLALLSFSGYAVGFAILWLTASWVACLAAVLLWTFSETLLFPSVDAMFADSGPGGNALVAFTMAGISAAAGESLGTFTGVALAGWLEPSGSLPAVYGAFTAAALVSLAVAFAISMRTLPPVGGGQGGATARKQP